MADPLKFNTKKLSRQLNNGMTNFVEETFKPSLKKRVDVLMDRIYKTITTPRRAASMKSGKFWKVGVPIDTGKLQSSIKKLPTVMQKGHIVGTIIQDGSVAPYGKFVEYGHAARKKNGEFSSFVPPQSFMRSAREMYKPQIKKIIKGR